MHYQSQICWCLSLNEIFLSYLACATLEVSLICTLFLQMSPVVPFPNKIVFPFLFKSYMGLRSLCSSGQKILRKFTTPAKLQHPLGVFGGGSFCIASNLLLNGFKHTFLFSIYIAFPMYCRLVLNNWHFLGDIFNPFFNKAFNMSSNLFVWDSFDGENNIRSSIIASQHFLLWRQFKIALIYDCHMEG